MALQGIAKSAIDISDGLIGDLGHILNRSNVGAKIYIDKIPCAPDLLPHINDAAGKQMLLAGGDDYELCFTAPPGYTQAIDDIALKLKLPLTPIGEIVPGLGLIILDERHQPLTLNLKSFDHFA